MDRFFLKLTGAILLIGILLVIVSACSTVPSTGIVTGSGFTTADITKIADASACLSYDWKDRGTASKGYIEGIALVYAKAACNPSRSDLAVVTKSLGDPTKDALAWYSIKDTSLESVFTLITGLGMRESSGEYCTGIDQGSDNYKSGHLVGSEAEAGLFQTSENSVGINPELPKLFTLYSSTPSNCFLPTFKAGVTCTKTDAINYGSGDALSFQALSKSCPAFAAEYAAIMVRTARGHYGPLISRAAEYRPACLTMYQAVGAFVKQNQEVCGVLK